MTFFDLLEKQDVATVYVSGCINSLLIAHHTDIATHLLVRMVSSSYVSLCFVQG